jgi:hypothetical protein
MVAYLEIRVLETNPAKLNRQGVRDDRDKRQNPVA